MAQRLSEVPEPLGDLNEAGQALWRSLWTAPEAAGWTLADIAAGTRMVALQVGFDGWSNPRILGEVRLLEDRFGCSPAARAALDRLRPPAGRPGVPAPPPLVPAAPSKTSSQGRKAEALRLLRGGTSDDDGPACA